MLIEKYWKQLLRLEVEQRTVIAVSAVCIQSSAGLAAIYEYRQVVARASLPNHR